MSTDCASATMRTNPLDWAAASWSRSQAWWRKSSGKRLSGNMADTQELAAYFQLLQGFEDTPSLTLMSYDAEGAAVVIAAFVNCRAELQAKLAEPVVRR